MKISQAENGQWSVIRDDGSIFLGPFETRAAAITGIREKAAERPPVLIVVYVPQAGWVIQQGGEIIAGPFSERPLDDLGEAEVSTVREVAGERADAWLRSGRAGDWMETLGFYSVVFRKCRQHLPPLSPEGDWRMRHVAMEAVDTCIEGAIGGPIMPWRVYEDLERLLDE